ncbi:hypothetical protein N7U66_01405 [Lacinutrix neustonica]|uniref:Uncharacterized protein n=1 Tax=Lacinutrix neustonica TaxID=2980107 RepID=A0A9E8SDR9_9FLAO|nr:hypothetical protein [Lacinutrix neustonica]WAC02406.1 hypothetical protein N7U66_01405 [Lacinutrix neustonica]
MYKTILLILMVFFTCSFTGQAQEKSINQIQQLIETYKKDPGGPYHRIKWFCKDGTEREPKDPCPDNIGGGIQHASFKTSALDLRRTNHLFFGEILADANKSDFLNKNENYSRLKQYQLGKYLASVDDGWVLRKAQFYRGALQSEDEEAWGKDFFEWLLKDEQFIYANYYFIRQALKDIPHNGDDNIAQLMRSQSKTISEDMSKFMDIRIKIHGQPEITDINPVKDFIVENKIPTDLKDDFDDLIETMRKYYAPIDFVILEKEMQRLPASNTTTKKFKPLLKIIK